MKKIFDNVLGKLFENKNKEEKVIKNNNINNSTLNCGNTYNNITKEEKKEELSKEASLILKSMYEEINKGANRFFNLADINPTDLRFFANSDTSGNHNYKGELFKEHKYEKRFHFSELISFGFIKKDGDSYKFTEEGYIKAEKISN